MKAVVLNKNIVVCENVLVASKVTERVMGLMFKKELSRKKSLLISPCNSIHTCFMRFSIDVIFIDKKNVIIHIIRKMKPWRFSLLYLKSKKVLELNSGSLGSDVIIGDQLEFVDV